MKKLLFCSSVIFALCGMLSNGYCFTNLGQTYTVPEGSTFNQTYPQDYLVGTLNVAGTYNITGGGMYPLEYPHLYINNINVSGTFNHNGGDIVASNGWYYSGLNVTVTPTGNYNENAGGSGGDSFLNQGTVQIAAGSGVGGTLFQNTGTVMVNGGYFDVRNLINDGFVSYTGVYDYTKQGYFGAMSNLDISNGVVTDIAGVQGLILTYDAPIPENTYLSNKTYLLSGGGLLTNFHDVVAATTNQSYYYTTTGWGAASISFDYWWEMGVTPPSYQPGFNFDVLALQADGGWQYIGQFDAYNSSTDWATSVFSLPGFDAGTQLRFVLNDYYPESDPIIYLRNFSVTYVPEPTTLLLLGLGLIGLAGVRRKFQK